MPRRCHPNSWSPSFDDFATGRLAAFPPSCSKFLKRGSVGSHWPQLACKLLSWMRLPSAGCLATAAEFEKRARGVQEACKKNSRSDGLEWAIELGVMAGSVRDATGWNGTDGQEIGSMRRGQQGCGLICGWGCGAWRGGDHSGEDGAAGGPAGQDVGDREGSGRGNGWPSDSSGLRGLGFVLAASLVLLLPPLVLLISALLWTDALGEAGVVVLGCAISLLLLLPAHLWLTSSHSAATCSRRGR